MTKEVTITQCADDIFTIIPFIARAVWVHVRDQATIPVTWSQFGLLGRLYKDPSYLTKLSREWGISKPGMSKTLSYLIERGWIERQQAPGNRRKPLVVTPLGREAYEGVHETVRQSLVQSLEGLNEEQLAQIVSALELLFETLA